MIKWGWWDDLVEPKSKARLAVSPFQNGLNIYIFDIWPSCPYLKPHDSLA